MPITTSVITLLTSSASAQPKVMGLDDYDVVWNSPSRDSAGSMPIGNGEVVLNTWVEQSGDLLMIIARTDSLSEISRVLKVGRVRVKFSPSPFSARSFRQHLKLREGAIEFSGSGDRFRLFVDSDANVVHLVGTMSQPRRVTASLEIWRDKERTLPASEMRSAWAVHDAPFPLIESADQLLQTNGTSVTWFHRNDTSVVPKLWENQTLIGLPGTWDPLINRTFGGQLNAKGLTKITPTQIGSPAAIRTLDLSIATHTNQSPRTWAAELGKVAASSTTAKATARTIQWWSKFWDRSWVFVSETPPKLEIPDNKFPLRLGEDSNGQNRFLGEIRRWVAVGRVEPVSQFGELQSEASAGSQFHPNKGLTLVADVRLDREAPGRILDKLTAGTSDGFLFDTHPGRSLRLIVGDLVLSAPNALSIGVWHRVAATVNAETGEAALYCDGVRVAHHAVQPGSPITRGYVLQRYVQACQGRGQYPIKFNGGYYTVEPTPMGIGANADYRSWGDCHWFQNVRHTVHPMLASGDFEMMEPFFKLYESSRRLAESRTRLYHKAEGAYFPETMTVFGTYSGGDYGWNRKGLQPKEVQCPWWDDAWNQGPELVALMLDRWDFTRDEAFLKKRTLPMADSILKYFDTRFRKDDRGRIILDPTQVVETYWEGVINDMPAVAGLISVLDRLNALPKRVLTAAQRVTYERLRKACPDIPLELDSGKRELAPAEKYVPKASNVENGELYAVWPFRIVTLSRPKLLPEARQAYAHRRNHLDVGWGYDGNVAALLGMTDEAARILRIKAANSHPAYRWPATWGPNFDWLPDQNHGGNLLSTTQLMLLQPEGQIIRVFSAWPRTWDVKFKLHAPGNTTVEAELRGGNITMLKVVPSSRSKDVVLPSGWMPHR